jgi:cytochrome c biogenesis protein CcmG/thiol:disulfide interchange protein DsbE
MDDRARSELVSGAELEEAAPEVPLPRRRRWRWVIAVAAFALAVTVSALALSPPRPPSLTVKGDGAAELFELENLRPGGEPVALAAYRGRPVVVNFFASWCVPCRQEMPGFQSVYEQVEDRVAFVGVNHQDSRRGGLQLVEETGVRYPSGYDPKGEVALSYGLYGMPTTLFISAEGQLLERRTGEMSERELRQTVDRLFPR